MVRATLQQPVPLQAFLVDGNAALYVRARIFDSNGNLVGTLFPVSFAQGLYSVNWTPVAEGYYSVIYEMFTDAGCTQPAQGYDPAAELYEVTAEKLYFARILGLLHENTSLDQQLYDSGNRLISARLRAYDSAANAQAAGTTGLLYQWNIVAAYDAQGRATLFRIDQV